MSNDLFKNLTETVVPSTPVKPAVAKVAKPADVVKTQAAPPPVAPQEAIVDEDDDLPTMDELTMLKQRATLMKVAYSNNIGIESLKAKIDAKLKDEEDTTDIDGNDLPNKISPIEPMVNTPTPVIPNEAPVEKPKSIRQTLQERELKLVRVRITNLDPKKKDLPGEIFTVANEFLGTIKKYVPYGEVTDNGYHLPVCILNQLKERTFVSIKTRRGNRGQQIVEHQNAKEFAIDVLEPLTITELAQLATAQQARGGLDQE